MSETSSLLYCYRCEENTNHQFVFSHDFAFRYLDAEGFVMWEPAVYSGLSCTTCTDLAIYIHSSLHVVGADSKYGELVYPKNREIYEGLPRRVAQAYKEALKVKRVSKIAFSLMGRRVVEEIAKDQGCSVSNLAEALNQLALTGKLSPWLSEAADVVRKIGNAAAHDGFAEFNEHHVDLIDELLYELVDNLYRGPSFLHTYRNMLEI